MCGRFAVKQTSTELATELDAVLTDSAPEYPKYNICPTTQIAVCISVNGTRRLGGMRWGFIPTVRAEHLTFGFGLNGGQKATFPRFDPIILRSLFVVIP